ncbi:MAG: extracellular solute-binding protein, partial [Cohnella sp.]|nr:extracellular solute-binding protein [Cohnella sp.]
VQYEVLKEAGYPQIKTLDQLYDILAAYYKKHPTIDGKETIAWAGFDGKEYLNNNPSMYAAGFPDHGKYLIGSDNVPRSNLTSDYIKRYYQFLNKIYNAGMLDKEYFTVNSQGLNAKLLEGRVLAGFFPGWWIGAAEKAIRASGHTERLYAYFPLTFDADTVSHVNTVTPTRNNWNWVITKKAKDPVRIIQFFDYLFSDEAQKLLAWGIEGVHYEVKNGKRVVLESYQKQLNADPNIAWKETITPFYGNSMIYGNGMKLEDGDYATPVTKDSIQNSYDPMTKEVLAKYGKTVWADFLPKVEIIPANMYTLPQPEDIKAEEKRMEEVSQKESPKLVFAKNQAEFDTAWNAYKTQMEKEGLKKAEASWGALWKQYLEAYNKAVGK